MKKGFINTLVLIAVVLLAVTNVKAVEAAPRLTLSPVSGSYSNGATFTVVIGVNSDGEKSSAVDVWMNFDKDKLEVTKIEKSTNPPFSFDMTPRIDNAAGTFEFSCASNNMSAFEDQPIVGDLAVVTFKTKAVGTAAVKFTCAAGSTTDSNIFNSDITDVISCAANSVGSYTITASTTGTTPTPTLTITPTPTTTTGTDNSTVTATPTKTSTSTSTTTTTSLPQTGSVGSTVGLIVFGVISLASALFLKFL